MSDEENQEELPIAVDKKSNYLTFNTNIAEYTIDDIFKLLDIDLSSLEDYEKLRDNVNEKVDQYVELFEKIENKDMVTFFENVRITILGEKMPQNITEAEKLLLIYDDKFNEEIKEKIGENYTNQINDTRDTFYNNTKGAGNPINRKTVTKLVNIDSRFRNFYNSTVSTDYKLELPYQVNNVIELKLSDLEFPTTFYPFNDEYENNYFWIKIDDEYIYVYIKPGNYYFESLIEQIQDIETLLNGSTTIDISFDLTYDNPGGVGQGSGKLSIASSKNLELNFYGSKLTSDMGDDYNKTHVIQNTDTEKVDFYNTTSNIPYQQRMGWMLGFRKDRYINNLSYTTEGILDILGPKYLYLVLDDLQKSSNINFFGNSERSLLSGNILARISLKSYAFSVQSQGDFRVYTEPRYYYGPVNIHKLEVKVIDEYGRVVNINGSDFSFALSLKTIYSQTN